jgi:hypothetical protein
MMPAQIAWSPETFRIVPRTPRQPDDEDDRRDCDGRNDGARQGEVVHGVKARRSTPLLARAAP